MWRRPPGPLGQGGAVKISKLRWTLCYSEPALLTVVKVSSLDFWISPVIYSWNKKQNFNYSKANLNRGFGSSTKPVWCSGWPLQVSWLCYNADAPVKSDQWIESPFISREFVSPNFKSSVLKESVPPTRLIKIKVSAFQVSTLSLFSCASSPPPPSQPTYTSGDSNTTKVHLLVICSFYLCKISGWESHVPSWPFPPFC